MELIRKVLFMSYDHPVFDEPVFEKIFPGPKPSAYFRASNDPHRIRLSLAEDFQWIIKELAKSNEICKEEIRQDELPSVNQVLLNIDFHPKFQDEFLIEKSSLLCFFVLLNLLPSKEGNFLWNTYFKYLRCSYEENEWDKKTVTKTAFYNHRNNYVSHFLALLSKPYAELVEDLTPEQKKWFPDYLLPNNFVNENDDPCVLSSYGQIIQNGPRKTDLSKEDSEKLNQRLLARKII